MLSFVKKPVNVHAILLTKDNVNAIGTDAFLEIESKATQSTVGTACTSPATLEESPRYVSSLLERGTTISVFFFINVNNKI